MSEKKLLTGPIDKKNPITVKNIFLFLGFLLFMSSGMFRTTLFATKDLLDQGKPYFEDSVDALKDVNPGMPEIAFVWNGETHVISQGMAPGKDWIELSGVSYSGSSGSGSYSGENNGDKAPSADELPPQAPPAEEDPTATYAKYKQQFVSLVGGIPPDNPDFTMLTFTNVKTARQLIANMKALNVDVVVPSTWNDQMEEEVKSAYEDCFQRADLNCVRNWDDVQITSSEPLGLREWLNNLMPDTQAIADVVNSARNTNADEVLSKLIDKMFADALAERTRIACQALGTNAPSANGTALDLQWCLSGKTVKVWIEELNSPNNFFPKEIGGGMGELGENDVVVFIYEEGKGYRVTAEVAIRAVPGLDFEAHQKFVEFPASPTLWDATSSPWSPGSPLP